MAVETAGTVHLRGEQGPGVPVTVRADKGRLRIESARGLVGDWALGEIGVKVLDDGFAIRAEGEELTLKTHDDVGIADELHVAAATPRMARKLAARHNPDRPLPQDAVVPQAPTKLAEVAFALGGAMVLLGGAFLREASLETANVASAGGSRFWLAFIGGGFLMVATAYVMSIGRSWARGVALLALAAVIAVFAFVVSEAVADAGHVIAYGFIAGGVVVGVAVLFGGAVRAD